MRDTSSGKGGATAADFDESAVIDALLADLAAVQDRFPGLTLHQYRILLEVLQAERRGTFHTIVSLARHVRLPMSTASRIVWQLTKDGGDVKSLRYERHPSDRRRKFVLIERAGVRKILPDDLLGTFRQRSTRKGALRERYSRAERSRQWRGASSP